MIAGELFEFLAAEAVEPAVADVENVGGAGFENEGGEGGDAAFFGGGKSLTLGDEPTVQGGEDALPGGFDLPGFGGFVEVVEESADAGFRSFFSGRGRRDAIGNASRDALGGEEVILRDVHAQEVFVLGLGANTVKNGNPHIRLLQGTGARSIMLTQRRPEL